MSSLIAWDQALFIFINSTATAGWLDWIMKVITYMGRAPWLFAPLWFILMIKGGKRERVLGLLLIPLFALADIIPAQVFKPLFGRLRPFIELDNVRLILTPSASISLYGFPSNHASNMFALGTFFILTAKRRWCVAVFSVAVVLVAYSRVYIGVHYPMDVLLGGLYGLGVGFLIYTIFRYLEQSYKLT